MFQTSYALFLLQTTQPVTTSPQFLQSISEVLRNPGVLPSLLEVSGDCSQAQGSTLGLCSGQEAAELAKPAVTARFMERLQLDIARSSLADCSYSPYADIAKQATGAERL